MFNCVDCLVELPLPLSRPTNHEINYVGAIPVMHLKAMMSSRLFRFTLSIPLSNLKAIPTEAADHLFHIHSVYIVIYIYKQGCSQFQMSEGGGG